MICLDPGTVTASANGRGYAVLPDPNSPEVCPAYFSVTEPSHMFLPKVARTVLWVS